MGMTASVLGASGYSGGELLRLLAGHPALQVAAAGAHSRAGETWGEALPNFGGVEGDLVDLETAAAVEADICFSCLPGGQLPERVGSIAADVVIDLSDDHRADPGWVYGLTEFARADVVGAKRIANPGCYPTATLLALTPFVRASLVQDPVVVDAMSGISGAGRRAEDRLLYANASDNTAAYGVVPHRHVPEMERGLKDFGGSAMTVSFTPHLVPMPRGLVATVRARLTRPLTDEEAFEVLADAYKQETFVHVTSAWPGSKAVNGSNAALVSAHVDERTGWLIASAAIDNLGKGAAGQALQNANVALGLEEDAGLTHIGVWP